MLHLLFLIGTTKAEKNKLILPYTSMVTLAKTFPHHEVFLLLMKMREPLIQGYMFLKFLDAE